MRAIHLFPAFAGMDKLQALREKFDPLAALIPPHLTLVFPFESPMSREELREHVRVALQGMKPFLLRMQGVTGADGGYLFLNVKRGNDEIVELHDRLYAGALRPFLRRDVTYVPHLTLGRLPDAEAFLQALEETERLEDVFETTVTEVVIEAIGRNEESVLEDVLLLEG